MASVGVQLGREVANPAGSILVAGKPGERIRDSDGEESTARGGYPGSIRGNKGGER